MSNKGKSLLASLGQITVTSLLAGACTVGAWLWITGGKVAVAQNIVEEHSNRIAKIESQMSLDHDRIVSIERDVKWIAQSLGKKD